MVPYDLHEEIAKVYGWRDSWLAAGGRLVPPDTRTVAMSAQAVSAVLLQSVQSCVCCFCSHCAVLAVSAIPAMAALY